MNYILLTFISAIFYGTHEFFKKIALKKSSVYEVLFLYTFVGTIISLFFFKDIITTPLIGVGFILLKSTIISIAWYLNLKGFEHLSVSVAAPFSLLSTVFVTVFAFFLFGEPISWQIIVGLLIVLGGLLLISKINKQESKKANDYRYIWILIVGAFLLSISSIIDKVIISNSYAGHGAILFYFMFFLCIIYGIIYYFKNNKKLDFKQLKTNYPIVFIGAATILTDLFYYAAVNIEDSHLGMISLVKRTSVFLTVLLGILFLKEKNILKKILVLVLIFVGLSLIILI